MTYLIYFLLYEVISASLISFLDEITEHVDLSEISFENKSYFIFKYTPFVSTVIIICLLFLVFTDNRYYDRMWEFLLNPNHSLGVYLARKLKKENK